jgi:hypothetical protein
MLKWEPDHLFICTSVEAPEATTLAALGLIEGAPNKHPGQGTACRRFVFRNFYVELLWVNDSSEATSPATRRTRLWERWSGRSSGACPFGFCFRPTADGHRGPPFASWDYHPAYLPDPLCLHIGTNIDVLNEPMLCGLTFARRPDSYSGAKRQSIDHLLGLREVTRVELVTPPMDDSPELAAVIKANLVRFRTGTQYHVELGFDGERQGKIADCRPALPLVLRW